jgi:ATP/maltotriose-dependent transcriptional regulator MalT/DNA-binding SARP family transcriptional activator
MNLAKILSPKPAQFLERERLTSTLFAWEDKKLVIIHAQAGQGKSTLAAGYVGTLPGRTVWYTLDREDDDPWAFLSTLDAAIRQAWPGASAVPVLSRPRYGGGDIGRDICKWIDLAFADAPGPVLLVFDDYPSGASSPVLRRVMQTLIDRTPPFVRLMIISRARPELDIVKLRAAQAVGELDGDDLMFTDSEVQDLFGAVFGMQISPTEAALINGTAEGWPAGLVLMHEYLAGLSPEARALAVADRRATGFQTHIFDYLAQEVFGHLPAEMQRFLIRTSIADTLSVPLIELLTGLPGTAPGQSASVAGMVKQLRARNLFVAAMDEEASVIRYHALFREFLRKKLHAQTNPSVVKKLHNVASTFFLKAGDSARSIDLLLASGQFDQAIRLIETHGEGLIARGRTGTLVRWIESLPLEHAGRPWLLLYRALSGRFTDPRAALGFYELALKGFRSGRVRRRRIAGEMLSLCGIIEACFYSGGNFKRMSGAAASASALLRRRSREAAEARPRLQLALGTAYFFLGKLRRGAASLQEALRAFSRTLDFYHQIQCAIYLAPCAIYLGDFRLAREAVRKGFEAHRSIPEEAGCEAALFMAQAMTALFEGQFDEAGECVTRCRGLAQENDLEAFDFLSLDIGGWLKTAAGDYPGAEVLLRQCRRKGEERENSFFTASAAHLLAVQYLHQNRLDEARIEAERALSIRARSGSGLFFAVSLAVSGAIELKQGRAKKAGRILDRALAIFRQNSAAQLEANALLLQAELHRRGKRDHEMKQFLKAGFSIGRERGFTYYFLFTKTETAELAETALRNDICADYCSALIGLATPLLKVHCLGGFRVLQGRDVVGDARWKSRRAKTLLKMLVAHEGLKLSREQAIEMLWPDKKPARPRETFNSMLHRLRKAVGDARPGKDIFCIHQERDLVTLNSELVWTDVGQFQDRLDAAVLLKDQPQKAVKEYEKAFSLYQGDFLPEDVYSDWATQIRDRIRVRYLKALEEAASLAESSGDRARALAFRENGFSADPCNEEACRWLMTRYLSEGRRNEAIRTYERCERALSTELDLAPAARTKRLFRSILGG